MTEQEVTLAAQQVSDVLKNDVAHIEAVAVKVKALGTQVWKNALAWVQKQAVKWGPWGVVAGLSAKIFGLL